MEFVKSVPIDEFNSFCYGCELNHYTKVNQFKEFKRSQGFRYHLVGVRENNQLIATALLQIKALNNMAHLSNSYAYVSYGYNLDYHNTELFSYMNQNIIAYAKELGAFFLRIDPNIPRIEHCKDGTIKENGFNNEFVTELLKKDGFIHLGYNYGYSGNWLSRYTYVLDISLPLEQIQKNIKRYSIYTKKNEMRDLHVIETGKEGLKVLYDGEVLLAKQQGFKPKPLSYFERLYDAFYPNVYVYVAQSNLSKAYNNLSQEIQKLENELLGCKESKKKEIESSIASLQKELQEMKQEGYDLKGLTPLGAKLIIQLKDKVFNVNMYTFKILPNFRVAFALHSKAIAECKTRDGKTYDFEGISGSLDPKDRYYGLFDFKRSFGGDFIEFLGEFDYPIVPMKYKGYRKIDPFMRRVKRKIHSIMQRGK